MDVSEYSKRVNSAEIESLVEMANDGKKVYETKVLPLIEHKDVFGWIYLISFGCGNVVNCFETADDITCTNAYPGEWRKFENTEH